MLYNINCINPGWINKCFQNGGGGSCSCKFIFIYIFFVWKCLIRRKKEKKKNHRYFLHLDLSSIWKKWSASSGLCCSVWFPLSCWRSEAQCGSYLGAVRGGKLVAEPVCDVETDLRIPTSSASWRSARTDTRQATGRPDEENRKFIQCLYDLSLLLTLV